MYDLINRHVQGVLHSIRQNHVLDYDWLVENLPQVGAPVYQRAYRRYWRMNRAIRNAHYFDAYFQALQAAQVVPSTPENLSRQLYQIPTHANGRQGLQFSFVTKLLHMVDGHAPIYDSAVAAFYSFQAPSCRHPVQQRIAALCEFRTFLIQEYARVLQNGLLASSIHQFRRHFQPQHFTDEKIIDSLIWGYVSLMTRGGLMNGQVIYR